MGYLKAKLDSMTDKQKLDFNSKNCLFCKIISRQVDSMKVYEDLDCMAILDIHPANKGHVILMPKKHFTIMPQLPDYLVSHMFMMAQKVSTAVLKAMKADGTNIYVANGTVAGQTSEHFIIHIIPRFKHDGIVSKINCSLIPKDKLDEIRRHLLQ